MVAFGEHADRPFRRDARGQCVLQLGDRALQFGDACRHWYAYDVAVSVYPYGERPERPRRRSMGFREGTRR